MLWVNNPFEETPKKYFILAVGLWYLKCIRLTAVAKNLSKMYSTGTVEAYFLPVGWTVAIIQGPRLMECLPFSGAGFCSWAVFSFLPPRRSNAQDAPRGSLGVARSTSVSHSTTGLLSHRCTHPQEKLASGSVCPGRRGKHGVQRGASCCLRRERYKTGIIGHTIHTGLFSLWI